MDQQYGTIDASGGLLLGWPDITLRFPQADEAYELVIRSAANGGGTVKRGPITIKPLDLARTSATPPLVPATTGGLMPLSAYTMITPGGFDVRYTDEQWNVFGLASFVESGSTFTIEGGFLMETQVSERFDAKTSPIDGLFPSFFGIKTEDITDDPKWVGWTKGGSIAPDVILPLGAPIDKFYRMLKGDRFATHVQADGTVNYYTNYLGAMSDPWWVSPEKLDMTLQYRLQFHNVPYPTGIAAGTYVVSVRNTRWLRNLPEFNYTGDMQRADNAGSLPSVVHVGLRKLSLHPLGPPSDWLYKSFTRP